MAISVGILFYLVGWFMAASFNIAEWDETLRIALGGFMLIIIVTTAGIMTANDEVNR